LRLGLWCEPKGGAHAGTAANGPESAATANAAEPLATPASTTPFGRFDRFVPPQPTELARFFPELEILELLGQGGMGAVYKARQRRLDRLVALKILPPDVARLPAFAERFTREAKTLARLNHPQIVTLYDFGETGGLYYFLMEYLSGMNLRRLLETGKLKPRQALAIVPQICEALQYAHEAGVVHRDIKPENILLDEKGRVKIADFGLAKLMSPDDTPAGRAAFALTGSHQVMGTPHYMAPEQMERPQGVDHRADIYSLGVVFYEMLTGELPLGRFAPPSRRVELDVRVDDVVLRSLEKEPDRRYQHANEVKSDVEHISRVELEPLSSGHLFDSEFDTFHPNDVPKQVTRAAGALGLTAAIGLIVSSWGLALALRFWVIGDASITSEVMLAVAMLPISITVAIGAIAMTRLERYRLCRTAAILSTLPCHFGWLIGLPAGLWALSILNRPKVRAAFAKHEQMPSRMLVRDAFLFILASLIVALVIAAVLPVLSIRGEHETTVASPLPHVPPVSISPSTMSHFELEPSPAWSLGPNGPALTDSFRRVLGLSPQRAEQVNKVLEAIYMESLELEARNFSRETDDAGHVIINISPYPQQTARLEDRLWLQLDGILNTEQQSTARLNLHLHPRTEPPVSLRDLVAPGFFGYGKSGARIELWRVGTWYHWKVQARGNTDSSSAPQLPIEYRRFWQESPKDSPRRG
jgi:tRNA A-37 threonylcarbamoyl transferase component Bud32